MITGIILAAGKGSRMQTKERNKTCLPFEGKALVQYGLDAYKSTVTNVFIVVGAFAQSVKNTIQKNEAVYFSYQRKRLGTGHALRVAIKDILIHGMRPELVLVGYGDHMMFYTPETINKLVILHRKKKASVSFLTTTYKDSDALGWGRIIRDKKKHILRVVEQKDATKKERLVTEINPGFYCFDFSFLKDAIDSLTKSEATDEYYITELIEIALTKHKTVLGLRVPFRDVGIGVNTKEQLSESLTLYKKTRRLSLTKPIYTLAFPES